MISHIINRRHGFSVLIGMFMGGLAAFALASLGVNPIVSSSPNLVVAGGREVAAGVKYAPTDLKKVANQIGTNWGFSVQVPRDFDVLYGAAGSGVLDNVPIKVSFPIDSFNWEKSNFGEAWVTFDASKISETKCYASIDDPSKQMTETAKIGTTTYFIDHPAGGAAAGNYYDSTVYRTFVNGLCFEADEVLHTSNIYNYDPGTVTEFDKTQTQTIFDSILSTIWFTTTP